jgi:putative membrane protein
MLLELFESFVPFSGSLVPFRGFGLVVPMESLLPIVVTTVVFVIIGLIVFALAFLVIAKATPFSVRKEIEEDHNVALAIVIASVILGSALIIAAAIHG